MKTRSTSRLFIISLLALTAWLFLSGFTSAQTGQQPGYYFYDANGNMYYYDPTTNQSFPANTNPFTSPQTYSAASYNTYSAYNAPNYSNFSNYYAYSYPYSYDYSFYSPYNYSNYYNYPYYSYYAGYNYRYFYDGRYHYYSSPYAYYQDRYGDKAGVCRAKLVGRDGNMVGPGNRNYRFRTCDVDWDY